MGRSYRTAADHGITAGLLQQLRANGATRAYQSQERTARRRAVPWRLSLAQWWRIWHDSGKWEQRGRGKGRYCLARPGDQGAYETGNAFVCAFDENSREARTHAKPANYSGNGNVHCLYPGTKKPWVAKHGNRMVGAFATREEATAAKTAFMSGGSAPAAITPPNTPAPLAPTPAREEPAPTAS